MPQEDESLKLPVERWKQDYDFKTLTTAFGSLAVSVVFAVYNGYLGVVHSSLWNGSICVYYLLLAVIRGVVLLTERKCADGGEAEAKRRRERAFLATSIILLVLNLALVVPISLLVRMQKPVDMGLIPAIVMAAYTTWKVTLAAVHMKRKGRSGNLLVRELRTLNFIDAIVSVLTLQNTLIAVNGGGSLLTLTAVTSAAAMAAIILISAHSLYRGLKSAKREG